MAEYTLTVETDDADEMADITAAIAQREVSEGAADESGASSGEKPKRTRRTKAQIAADEAAARGEGSAQVEQPAPAAPIDVFGDAAPTAAASTEVTMADLKQALGALIDSGKATPIQARDIVQKHGGGATTLAAIDDKALYPAVLAAISAAAA